MCKVGLVENSLKVVLEIVGATSKGFMSKVS